jgi:hypothetical protein
MPSETNPIIPLPVRQWQCGKQAYSETGLANK